MEFDYVINEFDHVLNCVIVNVLVSFFSVLQLR